MTLTFPKLTLVAANLVPLSGVFLMGWDASIIVLLYWTENLVIGFYNTLKMAIVKVSDPPAGHLRKFFAIPFFWLHFGGFCGMHGMFLLVLFKLGGGARNVFPQDIWPGPLAFVHLLVNTVSILWQHHPKGMEWPVLCLFASHGISFVQNYIGQKEYLVLNIGKLMNQPYARIFIMHVTIIAGGWIIMLLHSPILLVCLFVLLKISLDIYLHNKEHKTSLKTPEKEKHE